ncbi:unnamed protein product [Citrullus colocynthis]|uniref:Uncharacterized protein n=1 Tax=Citrullus colocynthis TaxID=252529 RepID=A0ABP0Z1H3_9ROSI
MYASNLALGSNIHPFACQKGNKKLTAGKRNRANLPESNLSLSRSYYIIQLPKILSKFQILSLLPFFLPERFCAEFFRRKKANIHLFWTNIFNLFNLLFLSSVTGSVAGKRSKQW